MHTNFKVIRLIRLAIEPYSAASDVGALTTRPSDLSFSILLIQTYVKNLPEGAKLTLEFACIHRVKELLL